LLSISELTIEARTPTGVRRLVDGLSLDVPAGKIVALVGASGAGKSTACLGALGVYPSGCARTGGDVLVDGSPQTPASLRRGVVAMALQNPRGAFNPVRTMAEHFNEILTALLVPAAQHAGRAATALRSAGVAAPHDVLGLYPFEMSGGMLQRAMLAICLCARPDFIFADEPTTDLDTVLQREILDVLAQAACQDEMGILLVTHDMGVVAAIADEVVVMDAGRRVDSAPVMDVFHHPEHPVTAAMVAAHLSMYGGRGPP